MATAPPEYWEAQRAAAAQQQALALQNAYGNLYNGNNPYLQLMRFAQAGPSPPPPALPKPAEPIDPTTARFQKIILEKK